MCRSRMLSSPRTFLSVPTPSGVREKKFLFAPASHKLTTPSPRAERIPKCIRYPAEQLVDEVVSTIIHKYGDFSAKT